MYEGERLPISIKSAQTCMYTVAAELFDTMYRMLNDIRRVHRRIDASFIIWCSQGSFCSYYIGISKRQVPALS